MNVEIVKMQFNQDLSLAQCVELATQLSVRKDTYFLKF